MTKKEEEFKLTIQKSSPDQPIPIGTERISLNTLTPEQKRLLFIYQEMTDIAGTNYGSVDLSPELAALILNI